MASRRRSPTATTNAAAAARDRWFWSALAVGAFGLLLSSVMDWHCSAASTTKAAAAAGEGYRNYGQNDGGEHGSSDRRRRSLSGVTGAAAAKDDGGDYLFSPAFGEDPHQIDDDMTRDKTCSEYLWNFLNGTTDANDVCQGMYNAWEAADCANEKHVKKRFYEDDGERRGSSHGGGGRRRRGNRSHGPPPSLSSWLWSTLVSDGGRPENDDDDAVRGSLSSLFVGRRHHTSDGNVTDDDVLIDDYFENWECCSHIRDYYGRHCRPAEWQNAGKLAAIMGVLVVCGLLRSVVKMCGACSAWIPDAAVCCLVGAVVGLVVRVAAGAGGGAASITEELTFDNDLFLHIMLPPIIFEAAISIDKRAFRRDLFPILHFAVAGTFFSAAAIGYLTFAVSRGLGALTGSAPLPVLDSLLFGALMSSIDPVATLGILGSVGVSHSDTLYTLIFGESLLNDGVSIVLFDSLVRHMGDADAVDPATLADIVVHFAKVLSGSVLVGCVAGAACTVYFWALQGRQSAVTEVALFFAWAMIPYYVADGLDLSGIIAIMVMGFMLDYYVIGGFQSDEGEWMDYMEMQRCNRQRQSRRRRLRQLQQLQQRQRGLDASESEGLMVMDHDDDDDDDHDDLHRHPVEPCFDRFRLAWSKAFSGRGHILSRSRNHVGFVAEVISNLMETAIFCYLGLFLFFDVSHSWTLTASGTLACVSSRAVMVILFSAAVNAAVWMDLEGCLARAWRACCQPRDDHDDDQPHYRTDEDDSLVSDTRVYLDFKTQVILFSAGVRGAVSYALVQNIPVYDAVTKTGSHFKSDLKAMTSTTIVTLIFAFGALTYWTVQRDLRVHVMDGGGGGSSRRPPEPSGDHHQVGGGGGPLTERLLSLTLASDDGEEGPELDDGDELFSTATPSEGLNHSSANFEIHLRPSGAAAAAAAAARATAETAEDAASRPRSSSSSSGRRY